MTMLSGLCLSFLSLLTPTAAAAAPPPLVAAGAEALVFVGVRVLDPATGTALAGQDVVVQGGVVQRVVPTGGALPPGLVAVDAAGLTVLPGLVDAHAHIRGTISPPWSLRLPDEAANLQAWLYSGVTTVLEAGGVDRDRGSDCRGRRSTLQWARAVESCGDLGPRILPTGGRLMPEHGHFQVAMEGLARDAMGWVGPRLARGVVRSMAHVVTTEAEARAAVRGLVARGSRFIKVDVEAAPGDAVGMPPAWLAAITAEAHAGQAKVLAHVGAPEDIDVALAAGVDLLAHGISTGPVRDDQIAALAEAGVAVITTLDLPMVYAEMARGDWQPTPLEAALASPRLLAAVSGAAGQRWRTTDPAFVAWIDAVDGPNPADNLRRMAAGGVTLVAGTDAVVPGLLPGAALHRELALLVEAAGLTPAQALAAATTDAHRVLGLAPARIDAGARADLLVVQGDPLADIRAVSVIACVVQDGVLLQRRCGPESDAPAACCLPDTAR